MALCFNFFSKRIQYPKPKTGSENTTKSIFVKNTTPIWYGGTFAQLRCISRSVCCLCTGTVHMGGLIPTCGISFSCFPEAIISDELRFHDTTRNTLMDASAKFLSFLQLYIHDRLENLFLWIVNTTLHNLIHTLAGTGPSFYHGSHFAACSIRGLWQLRLRKGLIFWLLAG